MAREAMQRTLGMRHFDVQLIGATVLHQGRISEMKTGEGKTLVAPMAAILNSPHWPRRPLSSPRTIGLRSGATRKWMGPVPLSGAFRG